MGQDTQKQIDTIRSFNRYYTNILGLIDQHILESGLSLAEVRVLYETGKTGCTPKMLAEALHVNAGYISRILKRLETAGWLERKASDGDARVQLLSLTEAGKEKLAALERSSEGQIVALIAPLAETQRAELVRSMAAVRTLLAGGKEIRPEDVTLRTETKPGDIGYLTYMHGCIYQEEYGYNASFEAYVAQSFFEYMQGGEPEKSRIWCAEHDGRTVGCIGIVGRGERAQLRWFLLDPLYRGIGLGKRLLDAALAFARETGFRKIYLETTDDLKDAVRMYEKAGFRKCAEKPNHSWREDLTELEFEMEL